MNIQQLRSLPAKPSLVHGTAVRATNKVATHRQEIISSGGHKVLANAGDLSVWGNNIDIDWLPAAAASYDISPNIHDYVVVPVPIVTADMPNRNLQAFPFEELSYFDPHLGGFVHQSFRGKPTHQDHENTDPLKAKGVIFDVNMTHVPKYGVWKVNILKGFCRQKDPIVTKAILSGELDSYSMGAMVGRFVCSICLGTDCQCRKRYASEGFLVKKRGELSKVAFQWCVGVTFFESSVVQTPADHTAVSKDVFAAV